MLVSIFMHAMEDSGLTREVHTCEEILEFGRSVGWERIQRIVITDFRPIVKKHPDGKEETITPNL